MTQSTMWANNLQLYRLAKQVVGLVAEERNLSSEQLSLLRIQTVFEWVKNNKSRLRQQLLSPESLEQLRVDKKTVRLFLTLFSCPFAAVRLLLPMWHLLVFSAQPALPVAVKNMKVTVEVEYSDGKVRSICLPTDLGAAEDVQRSHAYLTTMLKMLAGSLMDSMGNQALVALWAMDENGAVPTFEPTLQPAHAAEGYLGI